MFHGNKLQSFPVILELVRANLNVSCHSYVMKRHGQVAILAACYYEAYVVCE